MIDLVPVSTGDTLADYAAYTSLKPAVRDLEASAEAAVRRLQGRTVWMVNSTAKGGGVAEMMPAVVSLLRQLGVRTEWAVIGSDEPGFFPLTKRIHNLLHGAGEPDLSADDRALYESVSRRLADELGDRLSPDDLLVVHDPQPLGMGALLKRERRVRAVWRCHVGLGLRTPATEAAWAFLKPWATAYDRTLFSLEEYVPSFLAETAEVMEPTIDPLGDKNRDLSTHTLTGILTAAGLVAPDQPTVMPPFSTPALRLQPDGSDAPAAQPEDIGLLFRPIVTQISRWDRLKGFAPLLQGFATLKQERRPESAGQARRLDLVRLVLAGPDPAGVQDDPEAQAVVEEIRRLWLGLDPKVQHDVAVLKLPMDSLQANALTVNALQRCSSIVAQNSVQEGFGLTVTEAMWKARPVLGSHAAGIRSQVRDGQDGRLVRNPEDPAEIAAVVAEMLGDDAARDVWGRNARDHVTQNYLVFTQVRRWLEVLSSPGPVRPS